VKRLFGVPKIMFGSILAWSTMLLPAHAGAEEPLLILMTRPIDQAEWLIRQPDSAYTIQLLTVSSRGQVKEFVAGEPALPLDRLATFRYQSGDDLLYVLTLGRFDSVEAAYRARDALMLNGLVASDTWVRSLTDVKRRIRTTLQD
jgi:hypothetical protein